MNAARAVASGKWVVSRRLGKSHRRLRWICPDLAEHLEDRFGQRENTFLVSLADDAQDHLLRVDRGNGQRDRLGDSQAIGVDEA